MGGLGLVTWPSAVQSDLRDWKWSLDMLQLCPFMLTNTLNSKSYCILIKTKDSLGRLSVVLAESPEGLEDLVWMDEFSLNLALIGAWSDSLVSFPPCHLLDLLVQLVTLTLIKGKARFNIHWEIKKCLGLVGIGTTNRFYQSSLTSNRETIPSYYFYNVNTHFWKKEFYNELCLWIMWTRFLCGSAEFSSAFFLTRTLRFTPDLWPQSIHLVYTPGMPTWSVHLAYTPGMPT